MDFDLSLITNTVELCRKHYKPETFNHCLRVAYYAVNNICLESIDDKLSAYLVGLCHDLLEDTDVSLNDILMSTDDYTGLNKMALEALTKNKSETYIEYIRRLKASECHIAYIVKLADMKDHLIQKETLTDKLKEKYWEALPELL